MGTRKGFATRANSTERATHTPNATHGPNGASRRDPDAASACAADGATERAAGFGIDDWVSKDSVAVNAIRSPRTPRK